MNWRFGQHGFGHFVADRWWEKRRCNIACPVDNVRRLDIFINHVNIHILAACLCKGHFVCMLPLYNLRSLLYTFFVRLTVLLTFRLLDPVLHSTCVHANENKLRRRCTWSHSDTCYKSNHIDIGQHLKMKRRLADGFLYGIDGRWSHYLGLELWNAWCVVLITFHSVCFPICTFIVSWWWRQRTVVRACSTGVSKLHTINKRHCE